MEVAKPDKWFLGDFTCPISALIGTCPGALPSYNVGNVNKRLRRAVTVTLGMALAGGFLGMPVGYPHSLYRAVVDDPTPVLWGAGAGLVLGLIFALLSEIWV